ncbi:MBL fold metallo-hydrolase [Luteipulveratus mongoliensis]|uniref:Zn-dependent hydrolase n=1 Tax=Luteipulveratus mongoliensis TaxID=571913 RepID=A0A0K1JJ66_9MICO|nr:MBL fold metallo-hydrolase [Luteipulveratus mongoliensis]AKU16635.1 Zn-dependent hydrolase [Luteipulveratus mongoliensis]
MQITHHGHSCLQLDVAGSRIVIDPGVFSDLDSIEGADAICITHQHPDHLDLARFAGLLERSPDAIVYAEPQAANLLQDKGIEATDTSSGAAIEVGSVTVTPVGQKHAVIHQYIDRIDNLGLVVRAEGEPSFFHPGDALDADPGEVDFLGVPLSAPWCAVKETIAFVRRIAPQQAIVPIHDALLVPPARALYLSQVEGFGLDGGVAVRDLAGAGVQEL